MATNIKLKKSSVIGRAPLPGDLEYGEIAINYADGKLYYKNSSNEIKSFIDSDGVKQLIFSAGTSSSQGRALITDYSYLADSGQTEFTGPDEQGDILSYSGANLLVHRNGIILVNGIDYTANNGTSIVLTDAADSADVISVTTITGDSANVTNIVDSAYVQVRQDYSYNSLTNTPNILDSADVALIAQANDTTRDSSFVTDIVDADYINNLVTIPEAFDSNNVIGLVDSAYVQARVTLDGTGLDSAQVIQTIADANFTKYDSTDTIQILAAQNYASETFVTNQINELIGGAPATLDTLNEIAAALNDDDSAYNTLVNLIGQKTSYDSANTLGLIDSTYIQARVAAGTDSSTVVDIITDTVDSAFVNNLVTIPDAGTDSATVIELVRDIVDSAYILARENNVNGRVSIDDYSFTGAAGQTTFTGTDDNNNLLAYTVGNLQVHYNGLLLTSGNDYTATNGSSVVFTSAVDSGDAIVITAISGDSVYTSKLFQDFVDQVDSAYVQARQTAQDFAYSSLTGAPNVLDSANVSSIVTSYGYTSFDSTAAIALITANAIDSSVALELLLDSIETINLIDSAYVQARQTAQDFAYSSLTGAPNVLDSADIISITSILDSAVLNNPTLNSPVFGTGDSSPYFTEIRFNNSNIMKFNQMYTGAANGTYFTNGEYQKVATITPTANAENYQVVGRITAQNAADIHTVYFNAGLRSTVLPDLTWSITYNEEYNNTRYIDPQLWTKETTTAGFIFAFKTLATIYGTVTVDFEIIPRSNELLDNVVVNSVQNSEQTTVDTGFTARDMTRTHAVIGNNVRLGEFTFPVADGDANQVLGTNGSGTLQFVNQSSGLDSANVTDIVDSAYVQARQTAQDFAYSSLTGVPTTVDSGQTTTLINQAFADRAGVTNEIMVVDSTGNDFTTTDILTIDAATNRVGINQTSPEVTLHMTGEAAQTAQIRMEQHHNGGDAPDIRTRKSRGTAATPSKNAAGDFIYRQNHERYDGSAYVTVGQLAIDADGTNADRFKLTLTVSENGSTVDAAQHQFEIDGANSGAITFNQAYTFPTDDGTANYVLQTNGSGQLSWVAQSAGLDSSGVTGIVDSSYVQARQTVQDFAYSSLIGAPNVLDSTNVSNIVTGFGYTTFDSTAAIALITANAIDSSVALELLLDSIETINLIDSAYVQARQTAQDFAYSSLTGAPNVLDSTDVTNHITGSDLDMAGNKVLFGNVYSQLSDLPNASTYHGMFAHVHSTGAGYFAHAGNWVQLANNSDISTYGNSDVESLVDSAYVQARQLSVGSGGLDSSAITNLIDSAYINARVDAVSGSGVDSDAIINLVDSAYIQARTTNQNGISSVNQYNVVADSGQTVFDNVSFVNDDNIQVFLNGILLKPTEDYTTSNNNTITLADGADSGDEFRLVAFETYSQRVSVNDYIYTADSGQSSFTGVDNNGSTLYFTPGNVQVHLNGLMLTEGQDYTTSGSGTITLVSSAADGDAVVITAISGDSSYNDALFQSFLDRTTYGRVAANENLFVADSGQDSFGINYTPGAVQVYLNGILLSNTLDYTATNGTSVTLTSGATQGDTVIVTTIGGDSVRVQGEVESIVDSAYINARVDAVSGTDSATVISLVTDTVDSAYVQARQVDVYRDSAFVRSILKDGSVDVINFGDSTAWIDWNSVDGTLNLHYDGVSLQVGQEQHLYGKASEAISNGDVVMFAGVQGDHPLFAKADVTVPGFINEWVIGVATQDIANNEFGYVTTYGKVRGLNTSSFDPGSLLWLSPDSAGALTPNKPQAPNHSILIAAVTRSNPGDGHILVRPTFGTHLSDAHDVFIDSTTISNGQFITWDSANQYWTNSTLNLFDSAKAIGLIDSAYIQARQITYDVLDSANVQAILDSNFGSLQTSIIPADDIAIDLGSTTKRFRDLYLGPGSLYINNKKVIEDDAGTIRVRTDSDQNLSIRTFGTGQTTMQSETGINITATNTGDITFTTTDGNVEFNGNIQINSTKSINSSNSDPINFGDNIDLNSNRIENVGAPTADGDAATKLYVDTEINNLIDGAPGTLNTLNEIAAALNDDDSAYTTLVNLIGTKTSYDSADTLAFGYTTYDSTNAAGQIEAYGYLTSAIDSSNVIGLIDSAYIEARRPVEAIFNVVNSGASAYAFTGDGFVSSQNNPTIYLQRGLTYKFNINASSHPFEIRETSNGSAYSNGVTNNAQNNGELIFTVPMNAPNTLVYQCTIHSGMVGDIVILSESSISTFDSAQVIQIITNDNFTKYDSTDTISILSAQNYATQSYVTSTIDSAYINARVDVVSGTDSSTVIALIQSTVDSAYVALREANAGVISGGLDSAAIINLIDSAYITARETNPGITGGGSGIDSDAVTGLIDSAYIQTRQLLATPAAGLDSDNVIGLIDSAYIQARQSAGSGGGDTVYNSVSSYQFTADSGQTIFGGVDDLGNTLSYFSNQLQVFVNGILLLDSSDYTALTGTSITLTQPAEVDDRITVSSYRGGTNATIKTSVVSYEFIGDSGQTTFSGVDRDGNSLSYDVDNSVLVFLNGTLMVDANDYAATSGTSIVFTEGVDSGDNINIIKMSSSGLVTVDGLIDSIHVTQVANQAIFATVDSAYVTARVDATDSAAVIGIVTDTVDSAYIISKIDLGTDSATVLSLVEGLVDSAYVRARQAGEGGVEFETFSYYADSGQTTFTGADAKNNALSYQDDKLQVFLNGLLLADSDDYVASNGNTVTLNIGANADDLVNVISYKTRSNSLPVLNMAQYEYEADSGDTIFTGADDYGNGLSYTRDNLLVHLNGILLKDSADYTATDGSSVVLTSSADSADLITITTFSAGAVTNDLWRQAVSSIEAESNKKYIVDCSSSAITLTLPTSPSFGDEIKVIDGTGNAATNNITINRNGNKILGADSDFTLDINRSAIDLVYFNAAQGWIISGNT